MASLKLSAKHRVRMIWLGETHVVSSHRVPHCRLSLSLSLLDLACVGRSLVVGAIAAVRGQMCYTYEYVVKWMRWRGGREMEEMDGRRRKRLCCC